MSVASVGPGLACDLARPKSRIFTPSRVIMMFGGLTSRWVTPARWARSSASAIWMA